LVQLFDVKNVVGSGEFALRLGVEKASKVCAGSADIRGFLLQSAHRFQHEVEDPFSKIELVLTKREESGLQVFGADFILDHRSGGIEVSNSSSFYLFY
jgi:hypothetical protein